MQGVVILELEKNSKGYLITSMANGQKQQFVPFVEVKKDDTIQQKDIIKETEDVEIVNNKKKKKKKK
tara:strand:- start:186 stop:386 length:201 start_codon:yes stop_codon:yes gene_type:complete